NVYYFFFLFQAEDGIRDRNVTGVQTCALTISIMSFPLYRFVIQLTILGELLKYILKHLLCCQLTRQHYLIINQLRIVSLQEFLSSLSIGSLLLVSLTPLQKLRERQNKK